VSATFSSWFMLSDSTVISEELCASSDQNEVLWNFSRFNGDRRLTLKQNPHFYKRLPTSSRQYGGKYTSDPIESFQHDMISVLTDGPDRVYMEIAETRRAFGGVWTANNAIIFKGSSCSVKCLLSNRNTCFQTSVESSRARVSLEAPFGTPSAYRVSRSLCNLLPAGQQYRTGENQFLQCCNHRVSIA